MTPWEIGFTLAGYLMCGVGLAEIIGTRDGVKWFGIALFWPIRLAVEFLAFLGDAFLNRVWLLWLWVRER